MKTPFDSIRATDTHGRTPRHPLPCPPRFYVVPEHHCCGFSNRSHSHSPVRGVHGRSGCPQKFKESFFRSGCDAGSARREERA
jgi:hypothetical protein